MVTNTNSKREIFFDEIDITGDVMFKGFFFERERETGTPPVGFTMYLDFIDENDGLPPENPEMVVTGARGFAYEVISFDPVDTPDDVKREVGAAALPIYEAMMRIAND